MTRLQAWQNYLSADTRCEAAYRARRSSYDYETPSQARCKRWVADVQSTRRIAQDHGFGRRLDAAFARATAPRATMQQPSTTPWLDRAKWTGCMLGTAVRQVVDVAACIVGAMVGLARLILPTDQWGSIVPTVSPVVLNHSIAERLRQRLQAHLEDHPVEGLETSFQFAIDHNRCAIRLADKVWAHEAPVASKLEDLLAFCDNDPRWVQATSMVLNQFPANCAFEALQGEGNMQLRGMAVQLWAGAGPPEDGGGQGGLHAVREGENVLIHVSCRQRLALVRVSRDHAPIGTNADDDMPCDGTIQYSLTLRVPRPAGAVARVPQATVPRVDVTAFALQSHVTAPPAE